MSYHKMAYINIFTVQEMLNTVNNSVEDIAGDARRATDRCVVGHVSIQRIAPVGTTAVCRISPGITLGDRQRSIDIHLMQREPYISICENPKWFRF